MTKEQIIEHALGVNREDPRMLIDELRLIWEYLEDNYSGGNSLEIGAYKGMTSYLLTAFLKDKGQPESRHYVIDEFLEYKEENNSDVSWKYETHTRERLIENLGEYADYAVVTQGKSLSNEALEVVLRNEFDYVWIDGDHRFATLFGELMITDVITDKIIGHDYGHPGVVEAVDRFCKIKGYTVNVWDQRFGLFSIEKDGKEEE